MAGMRLSAVVAMFALIVPVPPPTVIVAFSF